MINNRGQALVEYVLIIALIIIIIVSIMSLISGYLHDAMTRTTCEMMTKHYVEGERPGDGYCIDFEEEEKEDEEDEENLEENEAED